MNVNEHYAALLGLGEEWTVTNVALDVGGRRIDIYVEYAKKSDNPSVFGMKERHRMIEITIRSKNSRTQPLGYRKHLFVIIAEVAHISKPHSLMPTRHDECGGGQGEVLVKKKLHGAATSSRSA